MKYSSLILVILFTFSFVYSCKKDENVEELVCESGPGGKLELVVNVAHHDTTLIPGAVVFIKYNVDELPGTDPAHYDAIVTTGTTGSETGQVRLTNMNCGRYFFYAEGYDSSINDSVSGGLPVTITQREGTYTINVPVTE